MDSSTRTQEMSRCGDLGPQGVRKVAKQGYNVNGLISQMYATTQ